MTRLTWIGLWIWVMISPCQASDPVEFNRDIRPILSENCFYCHGPDRNHRKAGLRLDNRENAIAKRAIVPGNVDASNLVSRIFSDDPEEVMPPHDSTKILTVAQKATLRRWVAEGGKYQAHWAYEPIQKRPFPSVRDSGWIKSPVDTFILATLESRGLKPSAEADRRTLLRRLSLDLIGLPPTLEELEAFEADHSPTAYEKVVDRLLASPHYGERMAVPWLDLARFADTVGYHGDQNQHVFPYRDYVIDAFNRNLAFDQFTTDQLAGDLLVNPSPSQIVATGFNRLNMMTREGGAQPGEYLAKYAGDRVRTVAITWLGSTMGCAECHDHKFDPFTARDFYRMAAFFGDVTQWGVYSDYNYTPNPELKGFTNDHPFPPEIEVKSPYLARRIARLDAQIRAVFESSQARSKQVDELGEWSQAARAFLDRNPTGWLTPVAKTDAGLDLVNQPDGSFFVNSRTPAKDGLAIVLEPGSGWLASLRLELLPRADLHDKILKNGVIIATVQTSAVVRSTAGKSHPLTFFHADADKKDARYANGSEILGVKNGWRVASRSLSTTQTAVYGLATPIKLVAGDQVVVTIKGEGVGCVRLAVSPFAFENPSHAILEDSLLHAIRADHRTPDQALALYSAYVLATGSDRQALDQYQRLAIDRLECRDGMALSMVTQAREPLPTRVLARGNWQDTSGELVTPGFPEFLPRPADTDGRRLNRLDLARWLTSPANPLTARVFVNRIWKQYFGTGLSAVMEDVGAQGETPSHPELLDWLATEFRDGWDVKALVKVVVMSAAYRQDARLRADLRDLDPGNRLIASQTPRRLEAEFVRDNALAIAGLLNRELGGPSVKPYQPPGYFAILQFPDRDYVPDRDDRQYRRGVYTHWQRTFLQPMLANFDAPGREECIASRVVANTPQQALTLLNDPTFVEAARALACSILAEPNLNDSTRLDRLFEKALARPTRPSERASLLAFLDKQKLEATDHPDEVAKLLRVGNILTEMNARPADLAAWIEVCRVVLNLHETITRY